jgi:hypothetical protein
MCLGFLGPALFRCKHPTKEGWISLDFLVRIEIYQWVTRKNRRTFFLGAFSVGRARNGAYRSDAVAQDWSCSQSNGYSDFPQWNARANPSVTSVPIGSPWPDAISLGREE